MSNNLTTQFNTAGFYAELNQKWLGNMGFCAIWVMLAGFAGFLLRTQLIEFYGHGGSKQIDRSPVRGQRNRTNLIARTAYHGSIEFALVAFYS